MANKTEILRGIGFLKSYSIPEIPISGSYDIPIAETDKDLATFFNVLDIINDDVVNIDVYLDGNSNRSLRILQGIDKTMTGSRFRSLRIINLSAAAVVTTGKVFVTIQKEIGRKEEQELKTLK